MFFLIVLPLVVAIINSWTYRIYQTSGLLVFLLVAQTVIFYLALIKKNKKSLVALIFVVFAFYTLISIKDFDLGIIKFPSSTPETLKVERRQLYYKTELNWYYWNRYGKIYFDKIKPLFDKYTQRLYSGLDFTWYFADYRLILFPFFVVGLIHLLKSANKFIFAILLLSFFIQGAVHLKAAGYIFYYPFINGAIALGVYKILKTDKE